MGKQLNLADISNEIAKQHVQVVDSGLAQYVESAIRLLEVQGKDITQYALVSVNNPMELKENRVKVTSQWRIVPVSELENLPTLEDAHHE